MQYPKNTLKISRRSSVTCKSAREGTSGGKKQQRGEILVRYSGFTQLFLLAFTAIYLFAGQRDNARQLLPLKKLKGGTTTR